MKLFPLFACTALVTAVAHAAPAAKPGDFDCLIEPSQMLEIRSPVSGLIEKVHVERGGSVRRGEPLVTLESSVERAAVELSKFRSTLEGSIQSAESRIAHAERKLQRKTDLAAENYASAQDRDDAAAERALAQADAVIARENRQLARLESAYQGAQLAQRVLRSPIDGVIVEVSMRAGELADASEAKASIMRIAQINPLRVKLILPVALYPKIKPGQRAEIVPEGPLEGRHTATLASIDKVIDAASGTFQLRLDLPNPQGTVLGGVRCRATLAGL